MRVDRVDPPREFAVGTRGATLRHVADVELEPDEVITLRASSGSEVDVTRKAWGYYLTPSLNRRLAEHGLRAALCQGVARAEGERPRVYVLAVEAGADAEFGAYLEAEGMRVLAWLDTDEAVERLAALLD